jgi:hypothetical protein
MRRDVGQRNMKKTLILCGLCCGLVVAAYALDDPPNPFSRIRPDRVVRVELYDFLEPHSDPFSNQAPTTPKKGKWKSTGVSITNTTAIAQMVSALSGLTFTNNFPYPAIGLLGHQFFIDRNGRILAVTTIVNHRATVIVATSPDDASRAGVRSDQFCRIVYDAMKVVLPGKIAALDALYKETPVGGLEAVLFEKGR